MSILDSLQAWKAQALAGGRLDVLAELRPAEWKTLDLAARCWFWCGAEEWTDGHALTSDQAPRLKAGLTTRPGEAPLSWDQPDVWRKILSDRFPLGVGLASMHADGFLRERAVRLLATWDDPRVGPLLALRAVDWVPEVRGVAREVLDRRADLVRGALPVLLVLEGRASGWLEAHVARVVQTHDPASLSWLLDPGLPEVRRAWVRLADLPPRVLEGLLEDRDPVVARQAGLAWLRSRQPALRLMRQADPGLRRRAAQRLMERGDVDSVELVLRDRSAQVRAVGIEHLRQRGEQPAAFYRAMLPDPRRRVTALRGLGQCGAAAAEVGAWLSDPSPAVRSAAAEAWVRCGGAPRALWPMLLDPSAAVVAAAARALYRLPAAAAQAAWASSQPWSRRAAWRLAAACGRWEALAAHLRAARDPELQADALGRLQAWLQQNQPGRIGTSEGVKQELRTLLDAAPLGGEVRERVGLFLRS